MSITTRPAILAQQPLWRLHSISRHVLWSTLLLLVACGGGDDSGSPPNTPLTTPTAMVANQDDTTMTTVRLDGKGSPVISTLSLGPVQADAIGGVTFSLGEWIFVTHTAGNRVAFIDPIGALKPILEDFLDDTKIPRIGQSPKQIYRDPVDKEVLWTMNEGADATLCSLGGIPISRASQCSITLTFPSVEPSHISLRPACLWGQGEQKAAFVRPTAGNPAITRQDVFVASKDTGLITVINNDPSDGGSRYLRGTFINLCNHHQTGVPGKRTKSKQFCSGCTRMVAYNREAVCLSLRIQLDCRDRPGDIGNHEDPRSILVALQLGDESFRRHLPGWAVPLCGR